MNARVLSTLAALLLAGPAFAQVEGTVAHSGIRRARRQGQRNRDGDARCQSAGHGCRFLSNDDPEQAAAKKLVHLADRHLRAPLHVRIRLRLSQGRHRRRAPAAERSGLEPHRRSRAARRKTPTSTCSCSSIGGKAQGLAVIASEPREFTIVNIVGNIDLEQLHDLEGNFGVPESRDRNRQEAGGTGAKTEVVRASSAQQRDDRRHREDQQERSAALMPPKTPSANSNTVTPSAMNSKV